MWAGALFNVELGPDTLLRIVTTAGLQHRLNPRLPQQARKHETRPASPNDRDLGAQRPPGVPRHRLGLPRVTR